VLNAVDYEELADAINEQHSHIVECDEEFSKVERDIEDAKRIRAEEDGALGLQIMEAKATLNALAKEKLAVMLEENALREEYALLTSRKRKATDVLLCKMEKRHKLDPFVPSVASPMAQAQAQAQEDGEVEAESEAASQTVADAEDTTGAMDIDPPAPAAENAEKDNTLINHSSVAAPVEAQTS
jgi:hypothetical protein